MSCPKNSPLPDHDPDQLFEVSLSWTPSKLDLCAYVSWDSKLGNGIPSLVGIMGVHVDDVLLGGRGELF